MLRWLSIALLLLLSTGDAAAFGLEDVHIREILQEHFVEITISLAILFVTWLCGLFPKLATLIVERHRRRRVARFLKAVSFDESELLDSLRNYIQPKCMDADPSAEPEPRYALTQARRPMFAEIDKILKSAEHRHILVLADSGMGKTSFLINYFYRNKARWFGKQNMRLVSLARTGADEEIEETPRDLRRSTVLLLDSLDEDPVAITDIRTRLEGLMSSSEDYKAVIIGCRTQFFSKDESIPERSGVLRVGPTKASESKEYSVARVYIAPFDDKDVRRYLRRCFPSPLEFNVRRRAKLIVEKVPLLTVRPMLLAHISDVMAADTEARTQGDIYEAMVHAWAAREDHWLKPAVLIEFSKALAYDLYANREERGGEFCSLEELESLLDMWKVDVTVERLTGRSLLNRLANGNVKFSHRSILEFFVANALLSGPAEIDISITDQMGVFILEALGVSTSSSEYLVRGRRLRFRTTSPVNLLGYPTNFGLYRSIAFRVEPASVFRARAMFVGAASEDETTVGEILLAAANYGRPGDFVSTVRLVAPNRHRNAEWLDCYMSAWSDEAVILSRFTVLSQDLLSAVGESTTGSGEIVLVGTSRNGSLTSLQWERHSRCDLIDSRDVSVSELEHHGSVSYHTDRADGLAIGLVSGGLTPGPLSGFGLMAGGSSGLLSRRRYFRLGRGQREL